MVFRQVLGLQKLTMNHPSDIVKMAVDNGVGTQEHLLAVANHYQSKHELNSTVDLYRFDSNSRKFVKFHNFTEKGPFELEFLTVTSNDGTKINLLAIGGNSNKVSNKASATVRVVIYEIKALGGNITFSEFQSFSAAGGVDAMKSFERHNLTYLVVGMRLQSTMVTEDPALVLVLVYNSEEKEFGYHSKIDADFISDIEIFPVGDLMLMIVAYYKDRSGNLNLDSPIYKFNDNIKSPNFELYQTIPTRGARDIEPFHVLGKSFIVVANEASGYANAKVLGVPSTLFEFIGTKFQLIQNIETYGAVRWKSAKVPTCQDRAVIVYGDQRDTIDQVGLFVYSEGSRRFQKLSLSLYHAINPSFRPQPKTLVPFTISENLYVAIGADDSTQGYTIYQLEYDRTANANPWEKEAEQISAEILYLKENLTLIEKAVEMLERDVRNIVYKNTKQNITGTKTFKGPLDINKLNLNKGDVSKGSILFDNGSAEYRADPTKFEFVNLTTMENNESRSEAMFRRLNNSFRDAVMIDRPMNMTNPLYISNVSLHSNSVAAENVAIEQCKINDINVCYLAKDTVFNNSSDVIRGANLFTTEQTLKQNLNANGKINEVKVSRDVVLQGKSQSIQAKKTFEDGVVFKSLNVSGNINGIDVAIDVIHLNKNETVSGDKLFGGMLSTKEIEIEGLIDSVNVSKLDTDTLRLTGQQTVLGTKIFNSEETLETKEDLIARSLTNSLDLDKWAATLVKISNNSSSANKNLIFKDIFQVDGNISASGLLNGLNFPQEAVQVSVRQNITGSKIFKARIAASGDVTVKRLVDGVDLKDAVTLMGNETITGTKVFGNDLTLTKNIKVAPLRLVDSVDISQLNEDVMKINKSQNVTGTLHFDNLDSKHDFTVKDFLDGLPMESYRKLYNNAVLFDQSQNIAGSIRFVGRLTIKKNLSFTGLVNGHEKTSFLHRFGDQQLENAFNFSNVNIRSNVVVKKLIDNIDVDNLGKDIIRTDKDQSMHGKKTFSDSVKLDGNLRMCCSINKTLLSNLLTKVLQQTITGAKNFKDVKVTGTLDVMHENVSVETTVDGIDLSNFTGRVIHVTGRLQIDKAMKFNNIIVKSPGRLQAGSINGVSIRELADDIVDLSNNQTISSDKRFTQLVTNGNLVAGSTVDGIDVSDVDREITRVGENAEISNNKEFRDVRAQDVEVEGLIHDVNLTKLVGDSVMKSESMKISGSKKISGNVLIGNDAMISRMNGLDVNKDVVLKSKVQNIIGNKIFTQDILVHGNIEVDGFVNKVNVSELDESAVEKNVEQKISGKKNLEKSLKINGDVVIQKFVDGVDLSELDAKSAKTKGNMVQNGTAVFHDYVNIEENLNVNGKVDGEDITALAEDAVMIHGSQNIKAKKTFERAVTVEKDITIDGDTIVNGLLNKINITSLEKDTLDTVSDQTIAGQKSFLKTIQMNEIIGARKLNGYETKEFVTVAGNQSVKGVKSFNSSVQAVGDVVAARLVDGEDISVLKSDTLAINNLQKQSVTGTKQFTTSLSMQSNVTVSGLLDGRVIDQKKVLDLDSEQNISGDANIHNDMHVSKDVSLQGKLSGNDLNVINKDRLTLNTDQTIRRNLDISSNIEARNVSVSGTTNGAHLKQYKSNVNTFARTAWFKGMLIDIVAKQRCPAFDYARSSIEAAPLHIDYFLNFQAFKGGINHIEPFKVGNDSFIALVRTYDKQTPCSPTEIMKYDRNKQRFVHHHYLLSASGTKCKSFKAADELYLVLENNGNVCQTKGQSMLFKWSTTSSIFEKFQLLQTNHVTDVAAITLRSGTTLLAITNAHPVTYTSNVTIWRKLHNETKFCCTQTMAASMASAVTMFEINGLYFLGVAMSLDPGLQSTRALSIIYKLGGNNTWVQLQQIATASASDIRSYNDSQHHFLAITNEKSENTQTHSSQKLGTEVYKYLPSKCLFLLDHSIPSTFPIGIEPFFLKTSHYLAIASKGFGLLIYRFRLHFGYQLTLSIPQPGITYVTSFVLDNELHLAVGSRSTTDNESKMAFYPRLLKAYWSGIRPSASLGCTQRRSTKTNEQTT